MFFSNNFKEQYQVQKGEDDLRLLPVVNYLAALMNNPKVELLAAPPSEIRSATLGDGAFRSQPMSSLYLLRYRIRISSGDVK